MNSHLAFEVVIKSSQIKVELELNYFATLKRNVEPIGWALHCHESCSRK